MYRIYTQNVNRPEIEAILNGELDSYTLIEAKGVYRSVPEDSLIVEVYGEVPLYVMEGIGRRIAKANRQESVILQRTETTEISIGRETYDDAWAV